MSKPPTAEAREWVDPLTSFLNEVSADDGDGDDDPQVVAMPAKVDAQEQDRDLEDETVMSSPVLVDRMQVFDKPNVHEKQEVTKLNGSSVSLNQGTFGDSGDVNKPQAVNSIASSSPLPEDSQVIQDLTQNSLATALDESVEEAGQSTINENGQQQFDGNEQPMDKLERALQYLGIYPGERLIMHLDRVYHVTHGNYDSGINLSPSSLKRVHASYAGADEDAISSATNVDNTLPIWSAAVTFYRLILYCFPTYQPDEDKNYALAKNMKCLNSKWISEREVNRKQSSSFNAIGPPIVLEMPLACLDTVTRIDGNPTFNTSPYSISSSRHVNSHLALLLIPKDHRPSLKFSFGTVGDCIRAHEAIQTYAFPGRRNLGYLFAFESRRPSGNAPVRNDGYVESRRHYNAYKEFERQGCLKNLGNLSSPWTLTSVNSEYQLCSSYSATLVVPRGASEDRGKAGTDILKGSAAFRSEGRLPSLTWGSSKHCGSIWRSSQPKVGLQTNRSSADEGYLQLLVDAVNRQRSLSNQKEELFDYAYKILDLRPKSSAMANRTQGYGYETSVGYPASHVKWCNIGNIHAVRSSWEKICKLFAVGANDEEKLVKWGSLVEDTKWLSFTRLILKAALDCANEVYYKKIPVLVHCSHGWDRTSQVCALAQIFLDPYYRTFPGFAALVEKDFQAFGHPFHLRCAHGESISNANGEQSCPIFMQFLDCAWQLVNLFPEYFEFDGKYILFIARHVYSCRFGTFLCDNERDRLLRAKIHEKTYSLWDAEYLGMRKEIDESKQVPLLPSLADILQGVNIWDDYFNLHRSFNPNSYGMQ